MYRGLYNENYILFEDRIAPKTVTGLPFGVSTFSDERDGYFKSLSNRKKMKIMGEINNRPLPKHFDVLVNLRCNVSSFAETVDGMQSGFLLQSLSVKVFASTPIITNARPSAIADAFIALSLEGNPVDKATLISELLLMLANFPLFHYSKSNTNRGSDHGTVH